MRQSLGGLEYWSGSRTVEVVRQREKTYVSWAAETFLVPMLPIILALVARAVSRRPVASAELLLWSPELPFATLFIGISCIGRLANFKITRSVWNEALSA